jgi:hypothetical protein
MTPRTLDGHSHDHGHQGDQHQAVATVDDIHKTYGPSVPSLFRQTSISTGKQREPTSSELPAQTAYPQVGLPVLEVRALLRRDGPDIPEDLACCRHAPDRDGDPSVPDTCPSDTCEI